jgi:hypothetical protein
LLLDRAMSVIANLLVSTMSPCASAGGTAANQRSSVRRPKSFNWPVCVPGPC